MEVIDLSFSRGMLQVGATAPGHAERSRKLIAEHIPPLAPVKPSDRPKLDRFELGSQERRLVKVHHLKKYRPVLRASQALERTFVLKHPIQELQSSRNYALDELSGPLAYTVHE